MTITQLEYIVAVDTHKSFAEAAKHCYVTQPTMSMQIKKIEQELEVLLFDRSKKPVMTTDIGRLIIEQARQILMETNRIKEIIKTEKGVVKGTLRIGIIPTLSPYLLPLFITKFIKAYPDVQLVIKELLSEQIIEELHHDKLDLGILVTPMNEKSIIEIPLFYETFAIYMSTSHPLSNRPKIDFKDLNINDMWLLKEGHCFRNQVIEICGDENLAEQPQLRFESGSLETIIRIVEKQHGYTLLPELALLDMAKVKEKYVHEFIAPKPIREVSMVVHRGFMKKGLIKLLQDSILENIPAHLKDKDRGKIINWK